MNAVSSSFAEELQATKSTSNGVQCLHKALELLCSFTPDHAEWGVTEMAAYLGVPKSAVHRILTTCEQYRFVERTKDRRYRLGAKVLELGHVYRFDTRILQTAEVILQSLAQEVAGIAHLAELDGYEVLELMRAEAKGSVRFTPSPKLRMPTHATALGKVLLAFSDSDYRERFFNRHLMLKRFTPHTYTTQDELLRELSKVTLQGYAVSNQESVLGCRCVAVPVRDDSGAVVAAVSVSGPYDRFSENRLRVLISNLSLSARTIEKSL